MDLPCRKVYLRSNPDNAGLIWLSSGLDAVEGNCWPLIIGDGVGPFYIQNLSEIRALFKNAGDKLAILFEVDKTEGGI